MSLINEALKKAQRSRSDSPDSAGLVVGEVLVAKRRPPTSAKVILLYATGGLVAFVLCVVGTVYYLNRPAPRPAAPAPAPIPVANTNPAAITTPSVTLPAATPAPQPAVPSTPPVPAPVAEKTAAAPAAEVVARPPEPVTPAAPVVNKPPLAVEAAPAPVVVNKPDERVQLYLETLRITAVRALGGGESRAMMNDRVYRVNDIVERNLGLRLTKVEAGQLTFTDANGVTYVKYF